MTAHRSNDAYADAVMRARPAPRREPLAAKWVTPKEGTMTMKQAPSPAAQKAGRVAGYGLVFGCVGIAALTMLVVALAIMVAALRWGFA